MNSQATGFGQSGLSILGGVAAAAGGPAGVGAAVGASTLSALLGAAQSAFGAGAAPAAIYGLISRVQAAWLAAMPAPMSTADAFALVEAFAEQCSLPNIQRAVMEAMTAVPVAASVAPAVAEVALPTRTAPRLSSGSRASRVRTNQPQSSYLQQEWQAMQAAGGRAAYERRVIVPRICIGSCG